MKIAKGILFLSFLIMSGALINGFVTGNFSEDGAEILNNPWGIVSLVDLYVGFVLFSLWIIYREKTWYIALIWVLLMMVLGFWTGALYTLIALYTSDSKWEKFWLGKHYKA